MGVEDVTEDEVGFLHNLKNESFFAVLCTVECSNYTPSPIDFATQLSLRREAPPKISPSKSAFEKCKPWGLFLGILRYFFKSAYLTNDGSD